MFKKLAVISAIVLVGAYILLRSGGGLLPGSKSARIAPNAVRGYSPTTEPTTQPGFKLKDPIEREFEVMSSTKSGRIVDGDLLAPTTNPSK